MKNGRNNLLKRQWIPALGLLALLTVLVFSAPGTGSSPIEQKVHARSDHFDGKLFFNPWNAEEGSKGNEETRHGGTLKYLWRWVFTNDLPPWPEIKEIPPSPRPPERITEGKIRITSVGHATFLIQMDGMNILTDPIWSDRCSPVSWAGPKRHQPPGLPFEYLPSIDLVLLSHNHYDHLDLPTLRRLAKTGATRALVPLGNRELVADTGIFEVKELDWWESVAASSAITVTMVPARHFSGRTPWDRNRTLWGGYVISGPSGHVYFAGDTAYGPHFLEIGEKFFPIIVALLPISPFSTGKPHDHTPIRFSLVHMGPREAVRAHIDLKAAMSLAGHFRVFRLGWDDFDDAVNGLYAALQENRLNAEAFKAPHPGEVIEAGALGGKYQAEIRYRSSVAN